MNMYIDLAGNPPNVKSQQPPFWRFRVKSDGKEQLIHSWSFSGRFEPTNNGDGTEQKASFLLWFSVYGEHSVKEENGTRALEVKLASTGSPPYFTFGTETQRFPAQTIRLYGAPDRVSQESPLWWRAVVGHTDLDISRFQVRGQATKENFRPGENIGQENPLRRLWLELVGTLTIDNKQNAIIELS